MFGPVPDRLRIAGRGSRSAEFGLCARALRARQFQASARRRSGSPGHAKPGGAPAPVPDAAAAKGGARWEVPHGLRASTGGSGPARSARQRERPFSGCPTPDGGRQRSRPMVRADACSCRPRGGLTLSGSSEALLLLALQLRGEMLCNESFLGAPVSPKVLARRVV